MLLLSGNVLLNFVPIINPEGKPWVVSVCHMSKHKITNVQLNELMSKETLLFMAECIPLKALGFSYWLLQHREDKQTTCGFKSRMRLFHLYPSNCPTRTYGGQALFNLCVSSAQTDSLFLCTSRNSCWFDLFLHHSLLLRL